jgi:hypothetical protein
VIDCVVKKTPVAYPQHNIVRQLIPDSGGKRDLFW